MYSIYNEREYISMKINARTSFSAALVALVALVAFPMAAAAGASGQQDAPAKTGKARLADVTEWYEAVGAVRPKTETTVESQVQAKILEIKVHPGQSVSKGDVLIILDGRELQSRVDQARQALNSATSARDQAKEAINSAQAAYDNAKADHGRIQTLFKSSTVTAQEMDRSEAEYRKADAALKQARDGLTRAEAQMSQAEKALEESVIASGYTQIKAQEDGDVSKRLAEPGDLAFPGKALLMLQTGRALRLEALVREGLISKVKPGDAFPVVIGALEESGQPEQIIATVEEVVPSADPVTRTFLVKAALPKLQNAYPGMFGRLMIPLTARKAVLVPQNAVRRIGQLEMVTVHKDGKWQDLSVKTGAARDGEIEILSGLDGDEEVALYPGG